MNQWTKKLKVRAWTFLVLWTLVFPAWAQIQTTADQMPYFPGCDHLEDGSEEKRQCSNQNLIAFVGNYLQYPEQAQSEELEGTVYVSFVVEASGLVGERKVLNDIGGDCGMAALDVIKKMPPWEPAVHMGQAVAVRLHLPIQFAFGNPEASREKDYKIHWGMLKGTRLTREELLANTAQPLQVRDVYGNEIPISELLFSFEKNRIYLDAKSNGRLTPDMHKVMRKSRKGGLFSIVATVQKDGEFVYVERVFEVLE